MQNLTPNVFVETGYYPTVSFVVTVAGVVAVDSPMNPPDAVAWAKAIASKGELRYLINAEHHADHILGDPFLGGTLISSEWTRDHFLDSVRSTENARQMLRQRSPESACFAEAYELRWPDVTYRERMTLRLGGTTFRLIQSPGHTRGQTIVHVVEERVAITADNIVHGAPPFFHAAALWSWFESLAMLESLDVDWYVPGHGTPCKKEWIPRLRGIMLGIVDEVRRAKGQGLSREEAQEKIRYIDRPGFSFPDYLAPRLRELQVLGIGNIYDQLGEHPAG